MLSTGFSLRAISFAHLLLNTRFSSLSCQTWLGVLSSQLLSLCGNGRAYFRQLPKFPVQNVQLKGLGDGVNSGWDYKLTPLPWCQQGNSLYPWLHGFALKVISSAHPPVSLNVIGSYNFQVFSPNILVIWGWRPHLIVIGAMTLSGFGIGIILTFWG